MSFSFDSFSSHERKTEIYSKRSGSEGRKCLADPLLIYMFFDLHAFDLHVLIYMFFDLRVF